MSQIASKLANSVRQAKTQQETKVQKAQDKDEVSKAPMAPKVESNEVPLPVFPSRRIWPD